MSRSGYSDDCDDQWGLIRWRGAVASATKGRRGQQLLKDLLVALDEMPEKKLITDSLIEKDGAVCALGALGKKRGIDMSGIDPENYDKVANTFGIASPLAQEIMYMNDEAWYCDTPEERFNRMRAWVSRQILPEKPDGSVS